MRATVDAVVAIGPRFLDGDIDADTMAHAMVRAVTGYSAADRAQSEPDERVQLALAEILTCGSGYLAGRCDAACVARTMTQLVNEFGA